MSIKNLFGKATKSAEVLAQDVESVKLIEKKEEKNVTYLPPIDFSDPSNFVYYGSAELYYSSSISNIYSNYPYDGSRSEQLEFESKFTHLDRWLFENKYPKTTGLINLGSTADTFLFNPSDVYAKTNTPEYIRVWGGLHTDNSANKLADKFSKSAKFDEETNRVQNWLLDFQQGSSIEFWMKKDSYDAVNEPNEVILDLWNSESVGTSNYRRLILQLDSSAVSLGTFKLILESGTTSLTTRISSNDVDIVSLSDWAHYAITIVETTSGLNIRFYKNGNEDKLSTISFSWSMYGRMNGFIGAMQTNRFDGEGGLAYGKLNASLDEFRFWKSLRSSRQIKLNWFSQVGGGANTDDDTSDLGVYFKFNEGIVGTNSIDKTVLDYSGRIANGLWFGYESTTSARSTESAIEIHGYSETPTPIIYETHPDIISLVSEMSSIGNAYDNLQGQNLYNSFPQWITEEDSKEQNLKKLVQVIASYLDSLNIQIKTLPNLKEKVYTEEGYVPSPYMKDALLDKGFQVSDIFSNDEIFEKMSSLNLQDNQFEKELVEIKNLIYTNIYNNLEKIYKAKGTENSIRNFIRCFGIDDELIRLNQYTDNGKQYLTDKARTTSVKKKYLNLNREDSFNATIYQTSSLSNPLTFISGSTSVINGSKNAFTLEADIYLPYKKEIGENGYFATPFISSSVFGFHEAIDSNPSDYTFASNYGFQVYVVKPSESSRDAKFVLKLGSTTLGETDWFYDAYHNTHWNLALRIKPETYPFGDSVTNTAPDYNFDLFVVSNDLQTGSSDFVSYQLQGMLGNSDGERIMSRAKRVYAGAHYQNFTGSLLEKTDIEIGRVSAWFDYLENEEIKQHNVDPLNYGTLRSVYGANLSTLDNYNIPASEMSIFTWDFDTVSSSDSSGEFEIDDITGGSTDTIYGWIDDVIRREYKAKGQNFVSETSDFLTNEFIVSQRKQLPESSFDSDKIYIKGEQEINFSDDEDVSDNLFLMEKSPSSILSDQIINTFSTIKEFSNLFGKPIDRYRVEYKELNKARELFFQRTNSDLDFDKFFEYFKWIDSSVSKMISQLVPLSTNFYSGVLDTVESHILERSKYQRQVGLLQTIESTEASIRGTQELSYNWKYGHKPLTNDEADNCNWWLERNERTEPEREQIKNVIIGQNDLPANNLSKTDGTVYSGNAYAISRLSKTYKVNTEIQNTIHGGINFDKNKDRDFLRTGIGLHSSLGLSGAPKNVVTFGAGPGTGLVEKKDCNDVYEPNKKIKFDGFGIVGIHTDYATVNYAPLSDEVSYFSRRKISHIFPGNIVVSDVTGGYAENINKAGSAGGYLEGVNVVNLHSDTTDITNEIPIQGPFTQQWTGGHQSRHVALNSVGKPKIIPSLNDLDDNFSRPEGYRFLIGKNPLVSTDPNSPDPDSDGAIGFTAPDYGIGMDGNFPDEDRKYAIFYREERTKRPINIKNIQTTLDTTVHGNFLNHYEVFSSFGDGGYCLRRQENSLLPVKISNSLPQTTNYLSLISQGPSSVGNIVGANSNRHPETIPSTPGTFASGEFTVFEKDYTFNSDVGTPSVAGGDRILFPGISKGIELDPKSNGGSFNDTGFPITPINGATNNDYWNNLKLNLNIFGYSVNRIDSVPEQGRAISFPTPLNPSAFLYATSSVGQFNSPTNKITFSTWFYVKTPTPPFPYGYLFNFMSGSSTAFDRVMSSSFNAFINNTQNLTIRFGGNTSTGWQYNQLVFPQGLLMDVPNTWHHLIISKDSGDQYNSVSVYLDSVLQTPSSFLNTFGAASGRTLGKLDGKTVFFNFRNTGTPNPGTDPSDELRSFSLSNMSFYDIMFTGVEAKKIYNNKFLKNITGSLSTLAPNAKAWYKTGFSPTDHIDPLNPPNNQGIYLVDVINGFNLSGSRIGDDRNVTFFDSIKQPQTSTMQLTANTAGSQYNIWTFNEYWETQAIPAIPELSSFAFTTPLIGGTDPFPGFEGSTINTQDRSIGSEHIIRTRFSAPGSSETLSTGYLNISTQEYSVYNSLNFRNLSVRMTGSGEQNKIRVDSHSHRREGLRMLRTRHQGQFGIDSVYGSISDLNYNSEASLHKQHRNNLSQPFIQTAEEQVIPILTPSFLGKSTIAKLKAQIGTDPNYVVANPTQFAVVSCYVKLNQNTPSTQNRYLFESSVGANIYSGLLIDANTRRITVKSLQRYAKWDLDAPGSPFNSVNLTQWNHFVAVFPTSGYTGSSNLFKLYINGINTSSFLDSQTGTLGGIIGDLFCGSSHDTVLSQNLEGQIALVSYYGRNTNVVSPAEINTMAADVDGSLVSTIIGFKNFWSLDCSYDFSSGQPITDSYQLQDYNSVYPVTVISNNYTAEPTPFERIEILPEQIEIKQRFDNDHYHSLLPASDFQYSWINSSISGSNWKDNQVVLGYSPSNGLIRTSSGIDSAIKFPGISELYGV
jgi:hypothetical protein